MRHRRVLTTILVIPITLGTVLIAARPADLSWPAGLVQPRHWRIVGIGQVRLVHNYTGVMLSLIMSGFPFTFLLTLSYLTGIDPSLEQAAATLGAKARARFVHILMPLLAQGLAINLCLSFVQTFSVFPSAVLLGAPAGETRVISIAAYQAAYEQYDYSMASAIAMIMGFCQLARRHSDPCGAQLRLSRRRRRRERLTPMGSGQTGRRTAVGARDLGAGDLLHRQCHRDDRRRRASIRSARAGSVPGCRPASPRAGTSRPGTNSSSTTF